MKNNFRAYEILGNIAIVKFSREVKEKDKKKFANKILNENKSVKTILEKTGKVKGRLRKIQTKYLAGENTKEALYRENNCVFRFNVDKTYFSARLSNERKEIASYIKKGDNVLVMFAGIAPLPIIIAKNSQARRVYSNEINREANKYAQLNIELNKLKERVELVPGDIKRVALQLSHHQIPQFATSLKYGLYRELAHHPPKKRGDKRLNEVPSKFDVIAMPRPQLKDSFLKEAFMLSRKGTRVYYYDFCKEEEIDSIVEKVKEQSKKYKKKIKIIRVKKAGDIAPRRYRVRVDFVLM